MIRLLFLGFPAIMAGSSLLGLLAFRVILGIVILPVIPFPFNIPVAMFI